MKVFSNGKSYNPIVLDILTNLYKSFLFVGKNAVNGSIKNFAPNDISEIPIYYPDYKSKTNIIYTLCGGIADIMLAQLRHDGYICRKVFLKMEPFEFKQPYPYFNKQCIDYYKTGTSAYIDTILIAENVSFLDRNSIYEYTHALIEYWDIELNKYIAIDPSNCIIYPCSVKELLNGGFNYNMYNVEFNSIIESTEMIKSASMYLCSQTFWNSVYYNKIIY